MNNNFKAYFMLILCAFFWSGNFIVGKFATLYEIPPLTLNFFRWLIVLIILIPFIDPSSLLASHLSYGLYISYVGGNSSCYGHGGNWNRLGFGGLGALGTGG